MENKELQNLRNDYKAGELIEAYIDSNPFIQFQIWFKQVIESDFKEPNAMALSTVDKNNKPSSRIVLLKEMEADGFVFYTNYQSRKGLNIEQNNFGSLLFFWDKLERQVRVEGKIVKVSRNQSEQYFHSRPKLSQIGAHASNQSTKITGRSEIESKFKELKSQYENNEVPLPEYWGGYKLIPDYFEFWQGRSSRLHDRIEYNYTDSGNWEIGRLSP